MLNTKKEIFEDCVYAKNCDVCDCIKGINECILITSGELEIILKFVSRDYLQEYALKLIQLNELLSIFKEFSDGNMLGLRHFLANGLQIIYLSKIEGVVDCNSLEIAFKQNVKFKEIYDLIKKYFSKEENNIYEFKKLFLENLKYEMEINPCGKFDEIIKKYLI